MYFLKRSPLRRQAGDPLPQLAEPLARRHGRRMGDSHLRRRRVRDVPAAARAGGPRVPHGGHRHHPGGTLAGRDEWGFYTTLGASTLICFGLKLLAILAEQGLGYALGRTRYGPAIKRMVGVEPPSDTM
eukprot:8629194-Pyramimonas_sp.AAC.1